VRSTAKAVLHRLKQVRSTVLKVEATLAGFQFLLALGPLGIAIGLVLWARRRRTHSGPARRDATVPPATTTEIDKAAQVPATSANPAANGHAH
jgi:hypothetical protein